MSKNQKSIKEKMQTADDILSSLMDDLKDIDKQTTQDNPFTDELELELKLENDNFDINLDNESSLEGITGDVFEVPAESKLNILDQFNLTPNPPQPESSFFDRFSNSSDNAELPKAEVAAIHPPNQSENGPSLFASSEPVSPTADIAHLGDDEKTAATEVQSFISPVTDYESLDHSDGEKTVAVAGFSQRASEDYGDKVKVSVGQMRGNAFSSGYAAWGSSDSNLVHAENLRIAQEKILELEKENEKLRSQNEELIAASEIVKERADLLTGQIHEFKADRDALEQSFKNETSILKAQIMRKDAEIVKASMKIEELESRMKFDLKKIRVRERELENRLELIRAEKNALVKSKDEQILSIKRLQDQTQLEVESYRQKCVELNKIIDTNQESFKRTTRALRLAMANLELQEENKPALKKVD